MTARQSALACYDILATIFDHLDPAQSRGIPHTEESRRRCRRALASSTVVCSTLSHHALNVLWRELGSIHPLLRTLPNLKHVDFQFALSGAISNEGWSRFQLYADRVRAIAGSRAPEFTVPIHPSVWIFLAAKCKGSPLIPRLRSLLTLDVHLSDVPGLILLMSPSLRTLDLFFFLKQEEEDRQMIPHVVNSLMETLPVMAANLERFYCDVDIDLDHGYLKSFSQFVRLETLSITSLALDGDALQALSAVATLQDLSCSITLSNSSAPVMCPCTFQHLAGLRVTGPFDDLTAFIAACQLPSLTRIGLSIKEPSHTREPLDSFATICRRCNPALLTSFSADFHYEFSRPRPTCLMQYFEPLLAFRSIKSFYLIFSSAMPYISDNDLARFGAAWPLLSTFRVSYFLAGFLPRHELQPILNIVRPTLSGLVDLARRCPHLEAFRVPELDVSVVPEKTVALPLGHGLRSFWVNNIILPSLESPLYSEAAPVFDLVFPSSINLEDARKSVRLYATGWKKFLGQLEAIREARRASESVGGGGPGPL